MKTLILYDSVFGNTEKIAEELVKSLGSEAELVKAPNFKTEQLEKVKLLIAGSPTRAFQATKDLNAALQKIPPQALKEVKTASFDTRVSLQEVNSKLLTIMVKFFGYAAEKISQKLQKKGGTEIAPPEYFFVKDTEGPLMETELEKARLWTAKIKNIL